jgi:uncharacterized protein
MPTDATDARIKVERPAPETLSRLGVGRWPIWTKDVSTFDWEYDQQEVCFFLEGEVTVTTDQGSARLKTGDLVTFPRGLTCTWHVTKPVRKHYRFG